VLVRWLEPRKKHFLQEEVFFLLTLPLVDVPIPYFNMEKPGSPTGFQLACPIATILLILVSGSFLISCRGCVMDEHFLTIEHEGSCQAI